jgi:hypothetical protein
MRSSKKKLRVRYKNTMAQMAMIAGLGMICLSSSVGAAMMMGGGEEEGAVCTPEGTKDPNATYKYDAGGDCAMTCKTGYTKEDGACVETPVVPKPTGLYTIEQGLRHQTNNPEDGKTEDLWYASRPDVPWAKHYKFACEDLEGNESEKVGPYGPITNGPYGKPQIRFAPRDTKPCDPNKVVIYRSDTADGTYTDITPGVKSLDHNVAYDRIKPAFYDFNE